MAGRGEGLAKAARPEPSAGELAAAEELQAALEDYKRRNGRPFPTWSEVLEVLRSLGYRKPGQVQAPRAGGR